MSDLNFIPISSIKSENFLASQPPQEIKMRPPKTGSYWRCYLSYNRGTPQQPVVDEPLFELNICKGVVEQKDGEDGNVSWQLKLTIDDPLDQGGFDRAYFGCANVVALYKGPFGQPKFSATNPYGTLRNPLFQPINRQTGEHILGAKPIIWCKIDPKKSSFKQLVPKKNAQGVLLLDSEGLPEVEEVKIDYKALTECEITASVVLSYNNIYKGAMISPQVAIRSCVVLNVTGIHHVEHTKSEQLMNFVKKQITEDVDYFDKLATDVEKLRLQTPKSTPGSETSLLKPGSSVPIGFPTSIPPTPFQGDPSFFQTNTSIPSLAL